MIPIMLAQRQELLIDVIGQIGSLGNVAGSMSGHRNPRQHGPVSQQQTSAGADERLGLEVTK